MDCRRTCLEPANPNALGHDASISNSPRAKPRPVTTRAGMPAASIPHSRRSSSRAPRQATATVRRRTLPRAPCRRPVRLSRWCVARAPSGTRAAAPRQRATTLLATAAASVVRPTQWTARGRRTATRTVVASRRTTRSARARAKADNGPAAANPARVPRFDRTRGWLSGDSRPTPQTRREKERAML